MKKRGAEKILIVDGYNILNAAGLAATGGYALSDAREKLIERLHDYAAFSGQQVIVVFDAWQSDRRQRSHEERQPLRVVYTRRGETADAYIERLCDQYEVRAALGHIQVRVATSDNLEQTIVFGRGATRVSAREILGEMDGAQSERSRVSNSVRPEKRTIMERLPDEIQQKLEKLRRGE